MEAEELKLTPDMKRVVSEQRLGFVATVNADGTPNVSPKGTFIVVDDTTLAFGEIRSPGTLRNIAANPAVEINFVDPFVRKGYRFAGRASVMPRGHTDFEQLHARFSAYGDLAARMRAIVTISITRALPLASPAYDAGASESQIAQSWRQHFDGLMSRRGAGES